MVIQTGDSFAATVPCKVNKKKVKVPKPKGSKKVAKKKKKK